MNVLIIGKSGQVAWELMQTCPKNVNAVALGRNDIDITSQESIECAIYTHKPTVIINASAYTAVDKAELDKESAYLINVVAVELLAAASHKHQIRFVHISTDFVFDGQSNLAYKVSDNPNPINVYGVTKCDGEKAVLKYKNENFIVVRTSWAYSINGHNFVKSIIRKIKNNESLRVVDDQIGCPTYGPDLAKFIWRVLQVKNANSIYHWCDNGIASWYDFAFEVLSLAEKYCLVNSGKVSVVRCKTSDYASKIQRPVFSLLDNSQSQEILQSKHWRSNLNDFFRDNKKILMD
ncbi:dTDP-4-dehydrorhamnose reductase [Pseudoalteromonas luteoviolacea B = ATCC 29581]|nr:dTDP-4-dehydrorhamnose reductase [Pseudoalteromonas luteoviolacea B = ATCC 29581]